KDVAGLTVFADDSDGFFGRGEGTPGRQDFVLGAIDGGADVVGHAAIDGDISPDAGELLAGAGSVEGDTGAADEGAAGLEDEAGPAEAEAVARLLECAADRFGVLRYRWWRLGA